MVKRTVAAPSKELSKLTDAMPQGQMSLNQGRRVPLFLSHAPCLTNKHTLHHMKVERCDPRVGIQILNIIYTANAARRGEGVGNGSLQRRRVAKYLTSQHQLAGVYGANAEGLGGWCRCLIGWSKSVNRHQSRTILLDWRRSSCWLRLYGILVTAMQRST
jgi:hypothetical protein